MPPEPSGALELESDSAPLTIKATANGVALDARGARAGRVLIELGRLAKRQIHVGGSGANVRIYAHISDLPWQKTFDAVLDGAGLRSKEGENRDWGRVLDVNDPAVIANRYRPVPCIDMDPPEVLLIRARHPEALAPVIARTLLRCGEMIIAAPERSVLLVEGNSATRYRVHKLMQALEAEHPVSYSEDNVPRGQTFTRFDIPALTCPGAGRPAAPNLPDGQLFSAGGAVGDLMRHLAVAASTDVVVGCGGDQHVAHVPSESNALKGTAYQSGLVGGDSLVYVSSEFFYARARAFEAARPGGQPPVSHPVRTFKVPFPAEFATAAEAMAPGLYATPFAPASMVLVWGDETGMKRVEALAEAWKQ